MNCRRCSSKETVTDLTVLPDHTSAACALTCPWAQATPTVQPWGFLLIYTLGPRRQEESVPAALLTLQIHLSLSASMDTYTRGKYIANFTAYLLKNLQKKTERGSKCGSSTAVVLSHTVYVSLPGLDSVRQDPRICTSKHSFRACSCHQLGAHNREPLGSGST